MLLLTILVGLLAMVPRAAAGPKCIRCNQARGDEADCNYQYDPNDNEVECRNNEVCTTDIRCDGKGRVFWIKGCEKKKNIEVPMNEIFCEDGDRRCRLHCDTGDFCNEDVPWVMPMLLDCTDDPVGLVCTRCNQARGEQLDCNHQHIDGGNTVVCGLMERCTTDVRCDGKGRKMWIKGCENAAGITAMNQVICNDDDSGRTRCRYHCDGENLCNEHTTNAVFRDLECAAGTTPEATTTPQEGIKCTRCNQARGDEVDCNTQDIENGNVVRCAEDQVCTTDVRCDPKGRKMWIKGCENNFNGDLVMDTVSCNPDDTRCRVHCNDENFCNSYAPNAVWESLECYPQPTEAPDNDPVETTLLPTTTPEMTTEAQGPRCYVCDGETDGRDPECNAFGVQTCAANQACYSKFKCRQESAGTVIRKMCANITECDSFTIWGGENPQGNFVARECCLTDLCNEAAGTRLEDVVRFFVDTCDS